MKRDDWPSDWRGDWLLAQLPMGMLDDNFFMRFVRIFQDVATTFLDDADNLDNVVDVRVTPEPLIPWLGSWIAAPAMDPDHPDLSASKQRELVRQYAKILEWRGTYKGLAQLLELVSGAPVEITESGRVAVIATARIAGHDDEQTAANLPFAPPAVAVRVQSTGWLSDDDFVRLVADEVPADVALTITVEGKQLFPRVPAEATS
jgi:phage tail-like protein